MAGLELAIGSDTTTQDARSEARSMKGMGEAPAGLLRADHGLQASDYGAV